jgi:hypothetical protein
MNPIFQSELPIGDALISIRIPLTNQNRMEKDTRGVAT